MENLINGYLKIEPIEHTSFIASQKDTYEEMGKVLDVGRGVGVNGAMIPLGAIVKFDSFMARKYPRLGEEGKFDWYVHVDEIVSYTYENKEIPK